MHSAGPAEALIPDALVRNGGIVDAHHHLWALDRVDYPWLRARGEKRFFGDPTPIQTDYGPDRFENDRDGLPVTASVHIQVGTAAGAEVAETAWLDEQAERTGFPTAIVAFADLTSGGFERTLDRHAQASRRLRGVRQIVGRRADEDARTGSPALLDDARFLDGLRLLEARGLSFDLQLTPPLLARAFDLFAQVPNLPVALCHAGSPWDQSPNAIRDWARDLARFAQLPRSVCKLSGWSMFDPAWTAERLAILFGYVLDAFGFERVLWGSNYPVDKLYRSYGELCRTSLSLIAERDRAFVFAGNARQFYRI